jgi:hypothetical protein
MTDFQIDTDLWNLKLLVPNCTEYGLGEDNTILISSELYGICVVVVVVVQKYIRYGFQILIYRI